MVQNRFSIDRSNQIDQSEADVYQPSILQIDKILELLNQLIDWLPQSVLVYPVDATTVNIINNNTQNTQIYRVANTEAQIIYLSPRTPVINAYAIILNTNADRKFVVPPGGQLYAQSPLAGGQVRVEKLR